MKTISIANQKGGVSKTTTAGAIGAGLKLKGFKVLFIDLDGQGNLSYTMQADTKSFNLLEALQKPIQATQIIQTLQQGDIIASNAKLAAADNIITNTGKEYKLKELLKSVNKNYDYCIIDTPPALSILTINALTASNYILIPAQADIFSLQGIGQLNTTINTVKKYCNKDLIILGLLVTRYNARTIISRDIAEMLEQTAEQLHTKLYKTKIRECIAIKEAQATRQSIFEYAPRSNGAKDYKLLINELLREV